MRRIVVGVVVATVAAISCAATAQGEDAAAISVGPTQFSVFGRMSPLGEADEASFGLVLRGRGSPR